MDVKGEAGRGGNKGRIPTVSQQIGPTAQDLGSGPWSVPSPAPAAPTLSTCFQPNLPMTLPLVQGGGGHFEPTGIFEKLEAEEDSLCWVTRGVES